MNNETKHPKLSPRERIFNEITDLGNLECYSEELNLIIDLICSYDQDIKLCTRTDTTPSSIIWNEKIIRLNLSDKREKGLPVMWDLLHEYGHLMDGDPGIKKLSIEEIILREKSAWDKAQGVIEKILSSLISSIPQFQAHRDKCLESYLRQMNPQNFHHNKVESFYY